MCVRTCTIRLFKDKYNQNEIARALYLYIHMFVCTSIYIYILCESLAEKTTKRASRSTHKRKAKEKGTFLLVIIAVKNKVDVESKSSVDIRPSRMRIVTLQAV